MITDPGIYSCVPHADLPAGISPSAAKTLLYESPAVYKYQREHPKAPTRSMVLGTLTHALVLEGKRLYVVVPDRRTKAGKQAEAEAVAAGNVVVTLAEAAQIEGMAKAVHTHPGVASILSNGEPEQAIIWQDEDSGVTCRGYVDWLRSNAIVDLKTTRDASPDGFPREAAKLHYDLQHTFYRAGLLAITGDDLPFLHIAVETDPPHLVAVHHLPPSWRGDADMRRALDLYAQCADTDQWPGYGDDIIPSTWPAWAA